MTYRRAARYLSKDGYPSFKTLDAIFACSIASGSLASCTTSSHVSVAGKFFEDEDHTETPTQEEHHIDNVVNDIRSQMNCLHTMPSNGVEGICGSSQSVGKGKRKMKDTNEGKIG